MFHLCSKAERKINFDQFKKALALCAEKKYGNKDDVQKLIDKMCAGKGPVAVGATVRYLACHPMQDFVVTYICYKHSHQSTPGCCSYVTCKNCLCIPICCATDER